MKKRLFILTSLVFTLSFCHAQSTEKRVFFYRIKSPNSSLIPTKLSINGQIIVFTNDSQKILLLQTDSIKIDVVKKNLRKTSHIEEALKNDDNYFIIHPKQLDNTLIEVFVVEQVCKECYEDRIAKSKKIPRHQ